MRQSPSVVVRSRVRGFSGLTDSAVAPNARSLSLTVRRGLSRSISKTFMPALASDTATKSCPQALPQSSRREHFHNGAFNDHSRKHKFQGFLFTSEELVHTDSERPRIYPHSSSRNRSAFPLSVAGRHRGLLGISA